MAINIGRTILPMAQHVRGKRSAVTCHLKCADACAKGVCNTSPNTYFRDIVDAQLSRRALLGFGAAGAAAIVLAPAFAGGSRAVAATAPAAPVGARGAFGFEPISPVAHTIDEFTVPDGFDWTPILRWGDPLFADSPAFDPEPDRRRAGAPVRLQRRLHRHHPHLCHDGDPLREPRVHERGDHVPRRPARERPRARARRGPQGARAERRRADPRRRGVPLAARRRRAAQPPIPRRHDVRLHGASGRIRAAAHVASAGGATALGTFGNCAGGTTPWGTILSGEENFNGYFRSPGTSEADARYGLADEATVRGWEQIDPRFDARTPGFENEVNHFGWIVEIDPMDPSSTPRKHTAMGRFKHEGANVILAENGRAVAYMGDDERFDYLYKFVSRDAHADGDRAHNLTLLENGDLFVARFAGNSPEGEIDGSGRVPSDGSFDGTGEWIPLTRNGESAVEGMSIEEVLVYTRLAADKVGATKMDRPEDVEPNPLTGRVYVACTNNTQRGIDGDPAADEINPRTENRDGHIVEITEDGGDQTSTTFRWNLLLVAGDPAQNGRRTSRVSGRQGLADLVPRQRRLRLRRKPLDLDGRPAGNHRIQRRTIPCGSRGRRARQGRAVPVRATRGRDLRSGDPRRRVARVRRRSAPRRRRHVRGADVVVPRRDERCSARSRGRDGEHPAPHGRAGAAARRTGPRTHAEPDSDGRADRIALRVADREPVGVAECRAHGAPSAAPSATPSSSPSAAPSPAATETPAPGAPLSPTDGSVVGGLLAGAGALVAGGFALLTRRKRERETPADEA